MAEKKQQRRIITAEQAEKEFPGPSEFVHLHNHTLFSILDGVAQPEEYFRLCAERKWSAIAITEHGVLNSVPDNYFASKEHKVKYLPAIEWYFCDYELLRQKLSTAGVKMGDLKTQKQDLHSRLVRNRHLTVIAKNMNGYGNLLELNRVAWEKGFYYRPRIWFDLLAEYKEDLIVLSGCLNSPINYELRQGNLSSQDHIIGAISYINKFHSVFGEDFYIELQMPGIEGDLEVFRQLVAIADSRGIKTVVTSDTHYVDRKDFILQKVMMAIDQDTTINDPELFHVNSDEQFFKTRHELRATFNLNGYAQFISGSVFEAACDNTLEVADKCETFKPDLEPKLPRIGNADEELARRALYALRERGFHKDEHRYLIDGREVTYFEQMQLELERICEKEFASYFLITQDLVRKSLDNGWPLGPARGSAGGSLICYLLEITTIDPLKWGLSFERFLSPARGGYMLNVTMD